MSDFPLIPHPRLLENIIGMSQQSPPSGSTSLTTGATPLFKETRSLQTARKVRFSRRHFGRVSYGSFWFNLNRQR